jgi:hypothetical protein
VAGTGIGCPQPPPGRRRPGPAASVQSRHGRGGCGCRGPTQSPAADSDHCDCRAGAGSKTRTPAFKFKPAAIMIADSDCLIRTGKATPDHRMETGSAVKKNIGHKMEAIGIALGEPIAIRSNASLACIPSSPNPCETLSNILSTEKRPAYIESSNHSSNQTIQNSLLQAAYGLQQLQQKIQCTHTYSFVSINREQILRDNHSQFFLL